jgi:hypothetical protein
VAIRDPFPFGLLLAIPVVIGGLLVMSALILLWRSFCEFYVAIFKISEDLAVLRAGLENDRPAAPPPARTPSRAPGA